jgi:hypothetical protein
MPATMRADGMNAEVTMLPVTAGDATLIVWSDGGTRTRHAVLIDAGLRDNDAVSYLQSIGVFHLDLIILSHPDLDHLGGLLAIMTSRTMSVDRIWCFDLDFLRQFIRTGKIPSPQPATREVVYAYALRSTLDTFSDILTTASGKRVQVLQVSEGYKLGLGGILLEVLYPPQSFYDALHNPITIKQMLNRKVPDDWDRDRGERQDAKARQLSCQEQHERLTEKVDRPEMPDDGVHLSDLPEEFEHERSDAPEEQDEGREEESDQLPWRMIGTLYNNLSIVVKATVLGGINSPSILFPGDLTDWTTLVLRQWPNVKADILKVPHHGSKNVTCDLKALRDSMDHPFPWYRLFESSYPFCYPFHGPLSRAEWRNFYRSVRRGDPLDVIRDIVNPSHVLVFPHPQHRLPSMALHQFQSKLIANRTQRDASALSQKSNVPIPARILVGLERHDVTEI